MNDPTQELSGLLARVESAGRGQDFVEALYEAVFGEELEEGIHAADVWDLFKSPVDFQITSARIALGLV